MEIEKTQLQAWRNEMLVYKFALDEVNTKLNILNEEFQFIHNHNPIEHIKSRIKKPESIKKKLERKGLNLSIEEAKRELRDIAGIRVTCSFVNDIYRIVDLICSQDDIELVDIKDYIKKPKPNGYRSIHLIVKVPVFLAERKEKVFVELQIRTIAMDTWASLEHKIFYKYERDIPVELKDQLKEAANTVHALDAKMQYINEEVNEIKRINVEV
ncbi:GTP pyrophosphokinase [Saliterribacillus persicus]|uniref:Putative GTP pyrophosphokinase n=1 Tax=Saliterribacillus persicus TaxID=930114 RepID=A0A368XIS3_9BACI|nr:GTP pyrophosphokinase family protein [Saliterribacillus persicus]RCW67076.1 putative GTP pyrophosphokinase [Saliterribacillus persicus]